MIRSEDRFADRRPGWAVLAAALAVTLPSAAFAQTPQTPAAETQDDAVLLEADTLDQDDASHTLTAEGDVQVRHQGRSVRADRLTYDLQTHVILAEGHVQMVSPDGSVTYADQLQLDENLGVGLITNMQARLADNGRLAARTAARRPDGRDELSQIIYTSCPVCEDGDRPPTWALRARRAVRDTDKRVISYQGAALEVMGVPVLYLPWFAHPDPSAGPQSGFLAPDIGRNRRLGAFYEQPYYWRISPSSDMTLSARVHSHVHPLMGIDYRKRFWSGEVAFDSSLTYEQDFDSNGDTFGDETFRGHIFGRGLFRIDDYWHWGFGLERASDDLYLRRYDISGAGEARGPYVGDNARLVSQLYAIGQDDRSYAAVNFISFQGLRETDSAALMPLILPSAEYERVFRDPWLGGQIKWTSNTAMLSRSGGDFDARVSTGLSYSSQHVVGPGFLLTPFAQARGDYFHADTSTTPTEDFGRGVGLVGTELSWPMMRPGENIDLIVEPVVMAAYGSQGGDDPRIINEDSLNFELDDSNLFRPNAAPNYDLWEPGGRISAGFRATARAHDGKNASFIFGRRWRSENAPLFTAENNLEDQASDYVAAAQVDLGRPFGAIVRTRLDDRNLDIQRIDAEVRGAVWRLEGYARYYSIDGALASGDPSEELTTSIGVQLVRGWRVQFGVRRDLDSDVNLTQELRAIYEDDCTFLELAYTRSETVDRRLGPDEGFQIRIGLRTLGVLGGG